MVNHSISSLINEQDVNFCLVGFVEQYFWLTDGHTNTCEITLSFEIVELKNLKLFIRVYKYIIIR